MPTKQVKEVMTNLIVMEGAEGREECHCLPGARRPAEDHWLVFLEPGEEEGLVADGVQGWHDDLRGSDLVCLHLDLGYLVGPGSPVPLHFHLTTIHELFIWHKFIIY